MIKIREKKTEDRHFDDSVINLLAEFIVELHKKRVVHAKQYKSRSGHRQS